MRIVFSWLMRSSVPADAAPLTIAAAPSNNAATQTTLNRDTAPVTLCPAAIFDAFIIPVILVWAHSRPKAASRPPLGKQRASSLPNISHETGPAGLMAGADAGAVLSHPRARS